MFNFKIYFMSEQSPLSVVTEDIKKLLMRYAVPAIVAMTAASLYNMMDSIFIGHGVGALGIAGLAVTFPFINLAAAFGSLVGVGASTLVSEDGTKGFEKCRGGARECTFAEYRDRFFVYDGMPDFSGSDPLFFRGQCGHFAVCPRLYEGNPLW